MRVLFITWDGPQLSYLESLFLPVFERLQAHGIMFGVLQFTWGDNRAAEAACAARGIPYWRGTVCRRFGPLGPFLSALMGVVKARAVVRSYGANVLMPRGLMPALTLLSGGAGGLPIVFDADGLPADERVEFGGLDPGGVVYRLLRGIEALTARRARAVLVRTAAAARIIEARVGPGAPPIYVVSNGRDPEVYHPHAEADRLAVRDSLGVAPDTPLVLYLGSLGPKYCVDEVVRFCKAVRRRRPDAAFLVLTGDLRLAEEAFSDLAAAGKVFIRRAPVEETPRLIAAADVGLAFPAATFSTQAVVPIKVGEYLLGGVPVIGTGIGGDWQSVLRAQGGGDVGKMDETALERAADWFCDIVLADRDAFRRLARQLGESAFSVAASVENYLAALTHPALRK